MCNGAEGIGHNFVMILHFQEPWHTSSFTGLVLNILDTESFSFLVEILNFFKAFVSGFCKKHHFVKLKSSNTLLDYKVTLEKGKKQIYVQKKGEKVYKRLLLCKRWGKIFVGGTLNLSAY